MIFHIILSHFIRPLRIDIVKSRREIFVYVIFLLFFPPRITIEIHHHAFVHQKIGFPVQIVRAHHSHPGLPDVRNGTFLDWSDQQGDRQRRALRRHQVSAVGTFGGVQRV